MILRDRDANTAWTAASDGTLEERRYYCQNWRADVSAILTDTGKMVEWVKYSAYGIAYGLPVGDTDSDGDWDATDESNITGSYDVRKDADLDGSVGSKDITHAKSITGGYQTLGWNTLTSSAVNNRIGYAGYKFAPELAGNKWHVRNRMLDSFNGIWNRRDPLGYVDGMNLYQYVRGMPIVERDPFGTIGQPVLSIGEPVLCGVKGTSTSATDLSSACQPVPPAPCVGQACVRTFVTVRVIDSGNLNIVQCPGRPPFKESCCIEHLLRFLATNIPGATACSASSGDNCPAPCRCAQGTGPGTTTQDPPQCIVAPGPGIFVNLCAQCGCTVSVSWICFQCTIDQFSGTCVP